MNELAIVFEKSDKPMTDSLKIAKFFSKDHKHVLRNIEEKIFNDTDVEFTKTNFGLSHYKDGSGKSNKMYNITKDGFVLLAMGFTGKKAMDFKIQYINAFNNMAKFINELRTAKEEFKELSEAIRLAHPEELHSYHFSNEYDLINRIVLGMSTKKYKKANSIPENAKSIRPYLSADQVKAITRLEKFDTGLMLTVEKYDDRKQSLTRYYSRINNIKQITA